jgi:hypothetical protein
MLGREQPQPVVYGPVPVPSAAPAPPAPAPVEIAPRAPARPEPEPRRAAPPAPATIAVSINAMPWAVVKIDGREVGETPLAGIPLTPGRHTFEARMPDGTMRQQTLDVDAAHKAVVFQ